MQTRKQASPFSNMSDEQLIFFGFDDLSSMIEHEAPSDKSVFESSNGVFGYNEPFCKHCHSHKVVKTGYNTRELYTTDGEKNIVKVQRYYCKKCGTYSQTEFLDDYDAYSHFHKDTLSKSNKSKELENVSLRNISGFHKIFNNITISHETVRKSLILTDNLYYVNNDLELSGYYSYDVQWISVERTWYYRHVLFDLIHKIPVAELLTDNEKDETTEKFIKENIPSHKRTAIITDLKKSYDHIMDKLGFIHQKCIFHLRLNINEKIKTYLNETKRKYRSEYKKQHPNASNYKIKKYAEEKIKDEEREIKEYKELFFQLFEQQTYDKAINYIQLLKQEINNFPNVLKEYLINNFFPNYKKYLNYLKKEHYNKLEKTNNRLENYNGITLPKSEKKKFRTLTGVFNQILHRIKNWIENRKNQLTF